MGDLYEVRKSKFDEIQDTISVNGLVTGDAAIMVLSMRTSWNEHLFKVTGTAKRSPDDKANPVVGERLALARALESAAAKLRRSIRKEL